MEKNNCYLLTNLISYSSFGSPVTQRFSRWVWLDSSWFYPPFWMMSRDKRDANLTGVRTQRNLRCQAIWFIHAKDLIETIGILVVMFRVSVAIWDSKNHFSHWTVHTTCLLQFHVAFNSMHALPNRGTRLMITHFSGSAMVLKLSFYLDDLSVSAIHTTQR